MARYRLSHSADQDFFDIYIYGAQTFGVKQAEAYTAGMQVCYQIMISLMLLILGNSDYSRHCLNKVVI